MGHLSWAGEECQRRLTVGPETWKVKVTQGGVKKKKEWGREYFSRGKHAFKDPELKENMAYLRN